MTTDSPVPSLSEAEKSLPKLTKPQLALLVEMLSPEVVVRVVPRGSTPASAAAAEAHGR